MAGNYNSGLRTLTDNVSTATKYMEQLSSGKRINRASDDAAGLAIAEALATDAVKYEQGSRNVADGQSLLDIRDSALASISESVTKMSELAAQASNGVLNDAQRSSIAQQFNALRDEVNRTVATTEFNGQKLLDGNGISIQAGTGSTEDSQIAIDGGNTAAGLTALNSLDISTMSSAQSALGGLSDFVDSVNSTRAAAGASMSRLDTADSNNKVSRENSLSAEARIRDVDVASAATQKVSADIRTQASVAMNAQANQTAAMTLQLLK